MKTICIYHRIDLDGWMSAAIVKHWFIKNNERYYIKNLDTTGTEGTIPEGGEELYFIGWTHGDPLPYLHGYDLIIMCDIAYPIHEMLHLYGAKQSRFIWIDHHIFAIKEIDGAVEDLKLPPINGIRNTKYSACELTWLYFMSNPNNVHFDDNDVKNMPEIVRLLGRYDCFGHKGTNEEQKVLEFQYGARQCISNYEEAYRYLELAINPRKGDATGIILENGKSIYQYLCTEAKQTYKNGFEIFFNIDIPITDLEELFVSTKETKEVQYSFICFNKERFNPINFGIDYHKYGYDGAACFWYSNGEWNFSLYNDNGEVDCSEIAKQYGGGGHKGAAGFRIKDINKII